MSSPAPTTPTPDDILRFWFGDALLSDWPAQDRNGLWFGGGAALDADIRQRFGPLVDAAISGGLSDWESDPRSRLALLLLLDQFSRNAHRGSARAFAGDGRAQKLVLHTLALGQDTGLPTVGRVFLYLPLMHAESLPLQHECVMRFETLLKTRPPALAAPLQGHLRAARQHRDIVARFGRFPHRNTVLGRTSTPEELAFLTDGPSFGQ